jgi:hypothetical protein
VGEGGDDDLGRGLGRVHGESGFVVQGFECLELGGDQGGLHRGPGQGRAAPTVIVLRLVSFA